MSERVLTTGQICELTDRYLMHTYARYPIAIVQGRGARVVDADGNEFLDFLGGIAVNLLGHCHPAVTMAVEEQVRRLLHCSNLYYSQPGAQLGELLVKNGGLDKIFLCNSGAEANEGAFKLARKYQYRRGQPNRVRILSLTHAFHGRTAATLAATPKPSIQQGFGPLPAGFETIEAFDSEALARKLDDTVAAVIIEPVQGEGGVRVAPRSYLHQARELTRSRGALLVFDEIQCGLGRLGHRLFAYERFGVRPDIVTLAKGLGGGLPLGAICASNEVAESGFQPGDHASTFGANPVCCAAALATLRTIVDEGLLDRVADLGGQLMEQLGKVQQRMPGVIAEVRGAGLMVGVQLQVDANAVLARCHQLGLLASVAGGNVLRLLPPYVVSSDDIAHAAGIIERALHDVQVEANR